MLTTFLPRRAQCFYLLRRQLGSTAIHKGVDAAIQLFAANLLCPIILFSASMKCPNSAGVEITKARYMRPRQQ